MLVLAALPATQILISAPFDAVGTTRKDVVARFGEPLSVGTDIVGASKEGRPPDQVVTLDYPKTRVRVYESPVEATSHLIYVATADERFPFRSAVRVGADRETARNALGPPAFEDENQLLYLQPRADDPEKGDRVRLVLENGRIIGIEWTLSK